MCSKNENKSAIDFKPKLTNEEACELVRRLYGVNCLEICELKAYDDKNYRIKGECIDSQCIENIRTDGCVLKIMNGLESKDIPFVEAQNEIMLYLGGKGIICPTPIRNKNGDFYSVEKISKNHHIVRLLKFVSGTIFCEIEDNNYLYYCIGEYIAKLDDIMKGFTHNGLETHQSIWHLKSVLQVREYFYCIKDEKHSNLIKQIVIEFENTVMSNASNLEEGVIHGDFNEQNIVVDKNSKGFWIIKGVLDFGDMNIAYFLFELAIAITYAVIHSKDINVAGLVLAGYLSVREVPKLEIDLLKICICTRIVQSLVLGAYAYEKDPSNVYVLTTQKNGWDMLEKLWKIPNEDLLAKWYKIGNNFSLPKEVQE